MSGIVTLLTDFGTADSYVAEMKGVLLSLAPGATLVDVTHAVAPGDVAAAAYLLGRTWRRFPEGTVHLAVADPGVGTARRAVAFAHGGHWFVGPDNGVFTAVTGDEPVAFTELSVPGSAAPTFHGRDLFAPAAAALLRGAHPAGVAATGPLVRLASPPVERTGNTVTGAVVYVDRFGNAVTVLRAADLPDRCIVGAGGATFGPVRRTFADVAPGEPVAYIGSGGELELAVRDGSAAARFGLHPGVAVTAVVADR